MEEVGSELDEIIQHKHTHVDIPVEVDSERYITVDDDVEVADTMTEEEIVSLVRRNSLEYDDTDASPSKWSSRIVRESPQILTCTHTPPPTFLCDVLNIVENLCIEP